VYWSECYKGGRDRKRKKKRVERTVYDKADILKESQVRMLIPAREKIIPWYLDSRKSPYLTKDEQVLPEVKVNRPGWVTRARG